MGAEVSLNKNGSAPCRLIISYFCSSYKHSFFFHGNVKFQKANVRRMRGKNIVKKIQDFSMRIF